MNGSMAPSSNMSFVFFFFFQAEDGIRDLTVTGVQTCALPISPSSFRCGAFPTKYRCIWCCPPSSCLSGGFRHGGGSWPYGPSRRGLPFAPSARPARSGEGRVGEEGGFRGGPGHLKKKKRNKTE